MVRCDFPVSSASWAIVAVGISFITSSVVFVLSIILPIIMPFALSFGEINASSNGNLRVKKKQKKVHENTSLIVISISLSYNVSGCARWEGSGVL